MSFKDKLRSGAAKIQKAASEKYKQLQENQKKRRELIEKKEELLRKFRKKELKELKKEYDVVVYYNNLIHENPTAEDYVIALAKSEIPLELLERIVEEKNKKKTEFSEAKQMTIIKEFKMSGGSFIGNSMVVNNIFNDFSSAILGSKLDFKLKGEAIQKIDELKEIVSEGKKDESKIDKIFQWFTNNKSELATIATPFITKLLSYL